MSEPPHANQEFVFVFDSYSTSLSVNLICDVGPGFGTIIDMVARNVTNSSSHFVSLFNRPNISPS